jgi:replicative DNA helicase
MKQQTAVEWIEQEILNRDLSMNLSMKQILKQAREMEKDHMIEFAWECQEMFKHEIKEHFEEKFNDGGNK